MQLFMEEGVDQRLAFALMHGVIDADDAALEVDVAIVAHAIINNPSPEFAVVVDEGGSNVACGPRTR